MITLDLEMNDDYDSVAYSIVAHAINLFKISEDVEIELCSEDLSEYDHLAACYWGDNSATIVFNSAHSWSLPEFAQCLGHELVHVKQYAYKELSMLSGDTVKYKQKLYRTSNAMEYWLAPWELEARGYEAYFEQWMYWNCGQ